MITQHYMIDLIPAGDPVVVHVSQYDKLARILAFDLYTGGVAFEPPAGATAQIRGTKPDGTVFNYAMTVDGITVSIPIPQQMALVAGDVPCEIQIVGDGEAQLGTANFILRVERSALDEEAAESASDIPLFEQLTQQAMEAASDAEASAEDAQAAQSAAESLIPGTGTAGQYLQKTASGTQWNTIEFPSGGHTIYDESGNAMAEEDGLQFVGATVTDDSTNNRTVVTVTGGSGAGDLMIHVNFVPGTGYTVDHTYAEAVQNISDGGTPIVEYRYNSGQPTYYTLRSYNDTLMIFGYPAIGNVPLVYLYASGGVAFGSSRYDATSTVTVAASAWTNGQAVLSVSGITTASTVILGYLVSTTAADYEIMRAADIRVIGQAAGSITIEALGTVPTSDLTFQITRW